MPDIKENLIFNWQTYLKHTGTLVSGDFENLLSDTSLLMNNPKTLPDKINMKLLSNKKFFKELTAPPKGKGASPNCGLIVINEPIYLDSWLGSTNGLPIRSLSAEFLNLTPRVTQRNKAQGDAHPVSGRFNLGYVRTL